MMAKCQKKLFQSTLDLQLCSPCFPLLALHSPLPALFSTSISKKRRKLFFYPRASKTTSQNFGLRFRLIHLTSPNLNYMFKSGAILLYVAIILTVLPATTSDAAGVLCNLTVWLTTFGYSLCYGTILVKMLRVHHIFNNPSTQKKKVDSFLGSLDCDAKSTYI